MGLSLKESTIFWKGNYAVGNKGHEGTLQLLSGTLTRTADGKITGGRFVMDMNSIKNTDEEDEKGRKNLEDHLKSNDFFDVQKYPTATFTIVQIAPAALPNRYSVTGDLVMKGFSNRIVFTALINQNKEAISVKADHTLIRTLWGITYKSQGAFDFGNLKNDLISNAVPIRMELLFRKNDTGRITLHYISFST
ncbi:YceI family protein [Runella slithyformis]|nr:YceI family protein [Runella slithyformis]